MIRARRCSNLDSALRHAREYEELAFGSGEAATLSGLILHLEQLAADGHDMRYTSQGHDAVALMTYHAAKGLEWPVVVLSGLHSDRDANMWWPVVTGSAAADGDPLAERVLRSWTWPFGETDGPYGGLRGGSGLEGDALTSPEGLERSTREREENLRLLYVGCTRAKHKLIFAHRAGQYAWLKRLANVDTLLNPDLDPGEHELDGVDTSLVVRHLSPDLAEDLAIETPQQSRWIAWRSGADAPQTLERFHSPSRAAASCGDTSFHITSLAGAPYFPARGDETQYAAIGDAIHSYMAALHRCRHLQMLIGFAWRNVAFPPTLSPALYRHRYS